MSIDETSVAVIDDSGEKHLLTRAKILSAAQSQEPLPSHFAGGVLIEHERYEPVALVEAAGGVPPGSIPRSSAIAALRELAMIRSVSPHLGAATARSDPPRLRSQLARHVGEWVAVRNGVLLAADADLGTLIQRIEGDAAIQYIPTHGAP